MVCSSRKYLLLFLPVQTLGHYQSKASFSSWPEVFIIIPVIYKTSFLKYLGGRSVWVEPVFGSPCTKGVDLWGSQLYGGEFFLEASPPWVDSGSSVSV